MYSVDDHNDDDDDDDDVDSSEGLFLIRHQSKFVL